MQTVKAIAQSRPVEAREWALRRAMNIAHIHMEGRPVEERFALGADIAEALQSVFDMQQITIDALYAKQNAE